MLFRAEPIDMKLATTSTSYHRLKGNSLIQWDPRLFSRKEFSPIFFNLAMIFFPSMKLVPVLHAFPESYSSDIHVKITQLKPSATRSEWWPATCADRAASARSQWLCFENTWLLQDAAKSGISHPPCLVQRHLRPEWAQLQYRAGKRRRQTPLWPACWCARPAGKAPRRAGPDR